MASTSGYCSKMAHAVASWAAMVGHGAGFHVIAGNAGIGQQTLDGEMVANRGDVVAAANWERGPPTSTTWRAPESMSWRAIRRPPCS